MNDPHLDAIRTGLRLYRPAPPQRPPVISVPLVTLALAAGGVAAWTGFAVGAAPPTPSVTLIAGAGLMVTAVAECGVRHRVRGARRQAAFRTASEEFEVDVERALRGDRARSFDEVEVEAARLPSLVVARGMVSSRVVIEGDPVPLALSGGALIVRAPAVVRVEAPPALAGAVARGLIDQLVDRARRHGVDVGFAADPRRASWTVWASRDPAQHVVVQAVLPGRPLSGPGRHDCVLWFGPGGELRVCSDRQTGGTWVSAW